MEKIDVEFTYKKIYILNRISIINKNIFHISPYIIVVSLMIGMITVLLRDLLPAYVRIVCLFVFFLTYFVWLLSFFFEYIFMLLWKCPVCKGKLPWYLTTLGFLGGEGNRLVNEQVKEICDRKEKKIPLIQYKNSNLLIPKKCPHCGEILWKKYKQDLR